MQFVAKDCSRCEHHWHHLSHGSVLHCAELLLKYSSCLQIISLTMAASVSATGCIHEGRGQKLREDVLALCTPSAREHC